MNLPTQPNESLRKLNPHIYATPKRWWAGVSKAQNSKRLRQSSKPLLNKLEREWFNFLIAGWPNYPVPRAQAIRLKIGNGAWYKGDISALSWPQPEGPPMPTIWECKGPKEMKNVARGILAIKTAAAQWPEIAFWLVWKDGSVFKQQRVLP
jgi:hypothetical protein